MTKEEELAEIREVLREMEEEGIFESEIRKGERYYRLTLAGRVLMATGQLAREPSVWH